MLAQELNGRECARFPHRITAPHKKAPVAIDCETKSAQYNNIIITVSVDIDRVLRESDGDLVALIFLQENQRCYGPNRSDTSKYSCYRLMHNYFLFSSHLSLLHSLFCFSFVSTDPNRVLVSSGDL